MSSLSFAAVDIDLAREDDLDALLDVERRSNPHPWTREHFEDALRSGYLCYVAREATNATNATNAAQVEGQVVGFAIARVLVDDAELLLIAVHPSHRRSGCATLLLNALAARLVDNAKSPLHLEVRASNTSAIAFYEARGFSRSGLRKNYYPNGVLGNQREDALLMQKVL
jgi:[ribosomal protein S18]-alanine N-acetyltransferase